MNQSEQRPLLSNNDFLSELVIGMSDGVVVPFALTVGLSRVTESASVVGLTGIVALAAGAIAMGVGGYLTGKSETGLYKPVPESTGTKDEIKSFFANLGMSEELQAKVAEDVVREKQEWSEKITSDTQTLQHNRHASRTGLTIGLSYALGGLLPVGPYFLMEPATRALPFSIVISLLSLVVLGYLKSRVTGLAAIRGILLTTLTGCLAAAGAFIVARLFT